MAADQITPPVARWRQIANLLRREIEDGHVRPGAALPSESELTERFKLSRPTIRRAVQLLETEGLVITLHGKGTYVRTRPKQRLVARDRQVHRDERGYYFDPSAQNWIAVEPPSRTWGTVPADIAERLGIEVGEEALVRHRIMGRPDTKEPMQIATSYLPRTVAEGTILAEADTGPGGIYDRLEEMGHQLHWRETITARMPAPAEAESLRLPLATPILRVVRTTANQDGVPLEVNDTRMSADVFEVTYLIDRAQDAQRT